MMLTEPVAFLVISSWPCQVSRVRKGGNLKVPTGIISGGLPDVPSDVSPACADFANFSTQGDDEMMRWSWTFIDHILIYIYIYIADKITLMSDISVFLIAPLLFCLTVVGYHSSQHKSITSTQKPSLGNDVPAGSISSHRPTSNRQHQRGRSGESCRNGANFFKGYWWLSGYLASWNIVFIVFVTCVLIYLIYLYILKIKKQLTTCVYSLHIPFSKYTTRGFWCCNVVLVAQAYAASTVGGTKLSKLAQILSLCFCCSLPSTTRTLWNGILDSKISVLPPASLQLPSSCRMTFTRTLTCWWDSTYSPTKKHQLQVLRLSSDLVCHVCHVQKSGRTVGLSEGLSDVAAPRGHKAVRPPDAADPGPGAPLWDTVQPLLSASSRVFGCPWCTSTMACCWGLLRWSPSAFLLSTGAPFTISVEFVAFSVQDLSSILTNSLHMDASGSLLCPLWNAETETKRDLFSQLDPPQDDLNLWKSGLQQPGC